MKRLLKSPPTWAVLLLLVLVVVLVATRQGDSDVIRPKLSEFEAFVRDGKVKEATIYDNESRVRGVLEDGGEERDFQVTFPQTYGDELFQVLTEAQVPTNVARGGSGWLTTLALQVLPILIIFGIFLFLMSSMGGGGRGIMQFGKAKPKVMSKDEPKVTFADVAGANEAVEELHEIKEFLESPAKFQSIGAKIPKGVLLFGPPGTGKTLLARAVAGEAGVPFFSISGSDFVEMFVGVGASRVRDLFEQAKGSAPCIIFMDEIDAVGRHRGVGIGGGHDEREQTLNQLLVEMDGFDPRTGIILIAATNRPDVLDPALLRPGRFDRQITVDRPDIEGRKAILTVHAKDVPLHEDVDLEVLARRTPGFTGADLANLVNEAALITARHNGKQISMLELEEAIDRVIGGPERKNRVMSDKEKSVIAFHEGGHALVGHLLTHAHPVHKVSIIARGRALGWTLSLPEEDRNIVMRRELKAQMAVALGGRAAEEVVFGEPTTGASNDIEKLSEMARAMVTQYGMSDDLGPQQLGARDSDAFLGRSSTQANYSGEIAAKIDDEVRKLIDEAHETATAILTTHRDVLDRLAETLIEKETVDSKELEKVWGHLPPWDAPEQDSAPGATGLQSSAEERRKKERRATQRRKAAVDSAQVESERRASGERRVAQRRAAGSSAKGSPPKASATKTSSSASSQSQSQSQSKTTTTRTTTPSKAKPPTSRAPKPRGA